MDKKRVLIVDDVSTNLHLLVTLLKKKYIVSAATSGEKAIEIANKEPKPDIILLDVYMPGMDGFEVCEVLRKDISTKDIPVIFISSMDDEDEYNKVSSFGDNVDFLKKPITRDMVMEKMEKYIGVQKETELLDTNDSKNLDKPTIMVVDDAPENIKVIVEILKEDYKVSVAKTGQNTFELLEDGLMPDLILLDIIMPEMDGYEICERLKKDKRFTDIPIVFLTILENEHDIVKGFEMGAVDYVTKPVEPTVLKARIKTHLNLRLYQKQLLKNLQEKEKILLKQSKMAILGEMFENITHQWKQPLSVITLASDNLKMSNELEVLDSEKLDINLDAIKDSSVHLAQTIDDFRDFLKEDVKKQYFSVKEVIEKSLKLLSVKFNSENISIDQLELHDVEVFGYKNDLIQVLMNILNNAKDAFEEMDKNKVIKVSTKVLQDMVSIKIIDNGVGIEPVNIDKLFDKYFTTKAHNHGTGIGLYMSKILVQDYLKGTINVHIQDENTCFEILIPIKNL